MTRSATPGEPETALDKAWSDLLDEMWAKATGPDFEEMLEHHRPAIEAEARAESSAEMERLRAAARNVVDAVGSIDFGLQRLALNGRYPDYVRDPHYLLDKRADELAQALGDSHG